jgi:hypothetical protein
VLNYALEGIRNLYLQASKSCLTKRPSLLIENPPAPWDAGGSAF